jgi:uncharacterized membrane protein
MNFAGYNAGDILWLGSFGPGWIALLALLGAAVCGLSLYDLQPLRPARRWTLIALRGAVYLLAVLMLLEPAVDLKNISKVKNQIAVLVDTSRSMSLKVADGEVTRYAQVKAALAGFAPLAERTREDHTFTFYAFDTQLRPTSVEALAAPDAAADGVSTELGAALQDLAERYEGQELGGIVILSDGIDLGPLGRRVKRGEPLDEGTIAQLKRLKAPIHTIAAARADGLKDLAVARVVRDDFAFVHNKVSVDVELQALGLPPQSIPVELRRDGEVLQRKIVELTAEKTSYSVTFELVPRRIGKEIYTVSAPVFEDEALAENNVQHFLLRVLRDKVRVLHVVGRPSWDERFLRQLLKRNPNVDLVSFFILRTNQSIQKVPTEELSLIPFPTEELFEQELGSFDLIVFQNFNFGPYNMRQYLGNIAKFVRDGGGFVMVGGDLSFASGGYAGTPIEEILPVELPGGTSQGLVNEDTFSPQLTEAGLRHPMTQLAFDPASNRELWSKLPQLHGTNLVGAARKGATVLATHPTLKVRGQPMPTLAIQEVGQGRSMALTSDSLWRWAIQRVGQGGTPREYQLFWSNAIRWLIKDPELKLVQIELAENTWTPGAAVKVGVRVAKPDYSPAADAEGILRVSWRPLADLTRDGGAPSAPVVKTQTFKTDATGLATIELPVQDTGVWELHAEVQTEAGSFSDADTLLVTPDVSEWRDILPRDELLDAIAQVTGGSAQVLPSASVEDLRFEPPRAVQINRRRVIQLWDSAALFLLVLALLGVEWSLRRRWGRL